MANNANGNSLGISGDMADAPLQAKTVRELQELAQNAPVTRAKAKRPVISRAARLHLIDILSRWSGPGLALVAGASIYLAVLAGRTHPGRATAWALMMFSALWVCRRLRDNFRAGSNHASRPFRWRSSFTAAVSVLGVILASAPILLVPATAFAAHGIQIFALTIIISFATGLALIAHLPSAAAVVIPGAIFAILTGLRGNDAGLLAAAVATSVLGIAGLYLANRMLEQNAAKRFPRTTFLRREIDRREENYGEDRDSGTEALQA
ncbi:hypothetical protein [Hyphococcus sp. DH-69]|uniref:hypothetical protein n=1 Tax=Hyphococcus formosus TaxID=3143534 RepID=UPI00398A72C5